MWGLKPASAGNWVSNIFDVVIPGRIERFLPLPRYHPWIFGTMMLGWGMNRQRAIMMNSNGRALGLTFPMFKGISSGPGSILGNGMWMSGLTFVAGAVVVSALATIVQEAN